MPNLQSSVSLAQDLLKLSRGDLPDRDKSIKDRNYS